MNRTVPNRKCVVFFLLLVVFGVVTAFGQIRLNPPTYYNRKAEEAYEKRNADIAPWVEDGTPPNPGNAALLYYQAFLLRPEPNEAISNKIHDVVALGAEPDRQVRTYLGYCLHVIKIVEIASRMQQCIWGVWPERRLSQEALRREIYSLYDILLVDARTLAADGHYRVALDRCLTVLRIARHLCEDPELDIFSRGSERHALRIVRYVLCVIPPDADILTWFRGRLGVVQGAPPSYAKEFQALVKAELKHIRTYPERLARLRNLLVEGAKDEQAKENARNLTDEQFLLRTSEGLQCFLDPIFRILDSEITYEQKRAEMQRIVSNLTEADNTDPVTKDILIMINMRGMINRQYSYYVEHQAHINGVKAAIEVYLVVAKTGQLPETLPEGLPKDPSTGRDFVYEITDEGFALRCQDEKFLSSPSRRLEFKVKK